MRLDAETALVTGASRGIGQSIALALARSGARVVGTATTRAGADAITEHLEQSHLSGFGTVLDVRSAESVEALFAHLQSASALPSILVNNAGIARDNLLVRMQAAEWDDVVDTNLSSLFRLCKGCARHMMKARHGRIINITSVVGATGNAGQANYAAAKAGIMGFTRALARELGPRGITVNAIAPGFIDTDMTRGLSDKNRDQMVAQIPLQRLGCVDDIAGAAVFLAGPSAAYITGATLHVNGGMYMC